MSQIEVTKLTQFNVIGPPADNIAVSKLTMFLLLTPGDGGEASPRQAHVYSQKIRRD
jgi:hypothetical protein